MHRVFRQVCSCVRQQKMDPDKSAEYIPSQGIVDYDQVERAIAELIRRQRLSEIASPVLVAENLDQKVKEANLLL